MRNRRDPTETASLEKVHLLLPPELIRQVDHMAVDWRLSRGPAMERLLRLGLDHPAVGLLWVTDSRVDAE